MFRDLGKYYLSFGLFAYFFEELRTGSSVPAGHKGMDVTSLDWNLYCKFQPNSFGCLENGTVFPRFYFDTKMESCKTFEDGGCFHSYNAFESLIHCSEACRDAGPNATVAKNLTTNIVCRLQPEFGLCRGYHPMFYYDISQRQCRGFAYSGCGGNNNRFASRPLCMASCSGQVEYYSNKTLNKINFM